MSDFELDELHLQLADMRRALCGAQVSQIWRTTIYDFAGCEKCIAVADQMMAEDERYEVTIHATSSRYDGRLGRAIERDEEGGYKVELPGVGQLLHFEASELEFTTAGAR